MRGYDLVVVDLPRCPDPAADVVLGRADETLLVMTNRVRAAAAALRVIDVLQGRSALPSLVVRSAPDTIRAFYNVCPHRGRRLRAGQRRR